MYKILTKIISGTVYNHFSKNNIFSNEQKKTYKVARITF